MTGDRINLVRARVTWCLRALAMIMLTTGTYLVVKRVLFGAGAGDFDIVMRSWSDDLGESSSLYRGMAMLVVGGALAGTAGRIARWIIALPRQGCPRCGHPTGASTRCPECGWGMDAPPPDATPPA